MSFALKLMKREGTKNISFIFSQSAPDDLDLLVGEWGSLTGPGQVDDCKQSAKAKSSRSLAFPGVPRRPFATKVRCPQNAVRAAAAASVHASAADKLPAFPLLVARRHRPD